MDEIFIRQCHPWMKSTDEVTDEGHGRSQDVPVSRKINRLNIRGRCRPRYLHVT